jgi:adenylate kinase
MRLVLLGAPGSGKGTQAVRIARRFDAVHISTGDILRRAIRDDTELGRKAQGYMNRGHLVPDQVMLDMVRDRLSRGDCDNGFILDGFPRTIHQAKGLQDLLADVQAPLDMVISLEVSAEPIIQRLSARRVCRKCGQDFNIHTNPPPPDMIHGGCGGEIVQRDDDKPDTVPKRLEVYREQTEPLKEYYRREGLLFEVDGMGTVDEVFDRVARLMHSS